MQKIRHAETVFVTLLAVWVLIAAFYYPLVPNQLASHFDGSGVPNGWSSKAVFFAILLGVMSLLAVVFLWLPRRSGFVAHKFSNVPNKEYWLAPERAESTWLYVREQMLWFGVATVVLEALVTTLAIDANLNPPPALSPWAGRFLLAYFVFVVVWLVRFYKHFRRVPDGHTVHSTT